jgi:hypothetical protein
MDSFQNLKKALTALYNDTIYSTGQLSISGDSSLDELFGFENENIETIFNPKFAFEFNLNLTEVSEVKDWNVDTGLLPGRKVMGKYFIDVGFYCGESLSVFDYVSGGHHRPKGSDSSLRPFHWDASPVFFSCLKHKKIIRLTQKPTNVYCQDYMTTTKTISWEEYKEKNIYLPTPVAPVEGKPVKFNFPVIETCCGCCPEERFTDPAVLRKEQQASFIPSQTIEFEVDNYLNLYHVDSGAYFLFSKEAYSQFPFYCRGERTTSTGLTTRIFQAKRVLNFTVDFNDLTKRSETFLDSLKEVIPEDYEEVSTFFRRFVVKIKKQVPVGDLISLNDEEELSEP